MFRFRLIPLLLVLLLSPASSFAWSPAACGYNPVVDGLLGRASPTRWFDWIRYLSGESPVSIGGASYTIQTRSSRLLFSGASHAKAYDFVLQQVQDWHYGNLIEEDPYLYPPTGETWKNLVVTIPGKVYPEQVVVLSAHLDNISNDALNSAPGADDNASGAAALLEAARIFRFYQFEKTVKMIWFSGEEQGLFGSRAYTDDHNLSGYQGVVNLDMFGFDSDGDRCFEIHAGTLAASDAVGRCLADGIPTYGLNLVYDYLTTLENDISDHLPFWEAKVGAVEILENAGRQTGGGCGGRADFNPYYHKTSDTIANSLGSAVGFDIARAGLAAVANLAGPLRACFNSAPTLAARLQGLAIRLEWSALPGASIYRVYRAPQGVAGQWSQVGQTPGLSWIDAGVPGGELFTYHVEAVAEDGICLSELSNDVSVQARLGYNLYLPLAGKQ